MIPIAPTPITQPTGDVLIPVFVVETSVSVPNVFEKKSIIGCSNMKVTKLPTKANDMR